MRWKKSGEKKGKINKAAIKNPVSGLSGSVPRLQLNFKSMHINRRSLQHYVHGNKRRLSTTHDSKVIICILNRTSVARLRQVTHNSFRNLVQETQLCKWQRCSRLTFPSLSLPPPACFRLPSLTTGEMFFAERVDSRVMPCQGI